MKYYIIAGEASGDLHGSNLIKELKKSDAEANIRCWGGDLMQQAGGDLVKHYKDLAFMGFIEVVTNLKAILRNLKFCKQDILRFQPDALVLIDYPGFNLPVAKWAKPHGIKTIFYISPQVWAWKENRVKLIKQYIDKMLVILPFEKEFYKKWNYDVEYVGHPLVEVIENYKVQGTRHKLPDTGNREPETGIIALLPGSRKQEILKKLPVMLEVAQSFPSYKFIVAKAPGQEDDFYDRLLTNYKNVTSIRSQTYDLLSKSTAALVTSGTATLETALFGVPQVVCYKGSHISYQIARLVVKVKYISLVNLIMNKEVVKELIQDDLTVENLRFELHELLYNEDRVIKLKRNYGELKKLLRQESSASARAAASIIRFLKPELAP